MGLHNYMAQTHHSLSARVSKSRALEKLSKLVVDCEIPASYLDRSSVTASLTNIHISPQVYTYSMYINSGTYISPLVYICLAVYTYQLWYIYQVMSTCQLTGIYVSTNVQAWTHLHLPTHVHKSTHVRILAHVHIQLFYTYQLRINSICYCISCRCFMYSTLLYHLPAGLLTEALAQFGQVCADAVATFWPHIWQAYPSSEGKVEMRQAWRPPIRRRNHGYSGRVWKSSWGREWEMEEIIIVVQMFLYPACHCKKYMFLLFHE